MVGYLQASGRDKRPWGHRRDLVAKRHLREAFAGLELRRLTVSRVRGYVDARRRDGVTPATVSRELAVLSSAINCARREWEWDIQSPVQGTILPGEPLGVQPRGAGESGMCDGASARRATVPGSRTSASTICNTPVRHGWSPLVYHYRRSEICRVTARSG